ncbi:MAG: Uma2 family endonuclease [Pirellulales bacterium]
MSIAETPRLFTVADYYAMAEAGILLPNERVELINGKVVSMSPQSSLHASLLTLIGDLLSERIEANVIVRRQLPIHLDSLNEPEPDIAVVAFRQDRYRDRHPVPNDVSLIVEVGVSSWKQDRREKLATYSQAGIVEVWLVNAARRTIEIRREPRDGVYMTDIEVSATDRFGPNAYSEAQFELAELFT